MREGASVAADTPAFASRRGDAMARGWAATPRLALLVVVGTMFSVSGGMLWLVGLNYEGLQGGAASKIHPATYLEVLLFVFVMLRSGNPVGYLMRVMALRPAGMALFIVTLVMFASIALRGAPGLAGAIDTYLGASLIVLLLADADTRTMRQLEILVHVLMTLNGLMGLFEFLSGHILFPYRFDGEVFPNDHRSAALQGHPLANATITTAYVLTLVSGGRLSFPAVMRLPMIGLQYAALVSFGGRTGLVASLIFGAIIGLARLHDVLKRGRVHLLGATMAMLLLTLVPLGIGGLIATGFFDAILDRFAADGGSAYARVQMFELFDRIPFRDLLVGPDAAYIDSIRRITGLEWGIENPIIRTVLYQGVLLTGLLTIAVVGYFLEIVRNTGPGILAPMLAFVFLINTSESIGGKTTALTKFAVFMLVLYPAVKSRPSTRRRMQPQGL